MSSAPNLHHLFAKEIRELSVETRNISAGMIRLTKNLDDSFDILDYITTSTLPERYYFRSKDGAFELAGLGEAYLIQGDDPDLVSEKLNALWQIDEKIRFFGGMRFGPSEHISREWSTFGAFRFVLPFVEFCRSGKGIQITLTQPCDDGMDVGTLVANILQQLKAVDIHKGAEPVPNVIARQSVTQIPEKPQWSGIVDKALSKIHRGEIGKIVLARKKIITAAEPFSPDWIVNRLSDVREKAFLFFYQPQHGSTFLGRTPERLFQLTRKRLSVDAIAGTEPRGVTKEEDEQYEQALTCSPKEREEQQIVARYVNDKMTHLCAKTRIMSDSSVLKLDKVQHLVTRFCGEPREGLTAFETLLALHPTPAVGVDPPAANGLIGELEPFERGWYAGPIGWMNRQSAEFVVAIRSALIVDDELHIFAGAGIVAQSEPDREWREIDDKMGNFSFVTGISK